MRENASRICAGRRLGVELTAPAALLLLSMQGSEEHQDGSSNDLDLMGNDKRRTVVGEQYGATVRKQLTVYGIFLAVSVGLVIAFLTVVSSIDNAEIALEDTAPWTQASAEQVRRAMWTSRATVPTTRFPRTRSARPRRLRPRTPRPAAERPRAPSAAQPPSRRRLDLIGEHRGPRHGPLAPALDQADGDLPALRGIGDRGSAAVLDPRPRLVAGS